jgi:hypothetical protein
MARVYPPANHMDLASMSKRTLMPPSVRAALRRALVFPTSGEAQVSREPLW